MCMYALTRWDHIAKSIDPIEGGDTPNEKLLFLACTANGMPRHKHNNLDTTICIQ